MVAKPEKFNHRDPWGGKRYTLAPVEFVPTILPSMVVQGQRDWLNGWDVFPRRVQVVVVPAIPTGQPCCAAHPNRQWLARMVSFTGYGAVWLTGTADGTEPGRDLCGDFAPAAVAVGYILSNDAKGPGPVAACDPPERADYLCARLRHMAYALCAQFYHDSTDPDVRECPLLRRHADAYGFSNGLCFRYLNGPLVLTDPASYLS